MHLYGKRPVLERLQKAPRTIRTLYLEEGTQAPEIIQTAKLSGISLIFLDRFRFSQLAGKNHTQGVLAQVDAFQYTQLETLLQMKNPQPVLFFLDRVTDPQNLGSIIRTLACLGSMGIVLPKHESAEVNETVFRVASGGENFVPIVRVTNLIPALEAAKKVGFWVVGTDAAEGTPLHETKWPWPLAIVLGSEGGGIRPGLTKHLEMKVTLPMPGAKLSYNVAIAAALLGYEITRLRLTHQLPS